MTTNETAKPCLSNKRKKPKAYMLVATLNFLGLFYRVLVLLGKIFEWFRSHWDVIKGFWKLFM